MFVGERPRGARSDGVARPRASRSAAAAARQSRAALRVAAGLPKGNIKVLMFPW